MFAVDAYLAILLHCWGYRGGEMTCCGSLLPLPAFVDILFWIGISIFEVSRKLEHVS